MMLADFGRRDISSTGSACRDFTAPAAELLFVLSVTFSHISFGCDTTGYQKELAVLLWHRSRDYADRKRLRACLGRSFGRIVLQCTAGHRKCMHAGLQLGRIKELHGKGERVARQIVVAPRRSLCARSAQTT
eukprot:s2071_g13.t1